MAMPTNGTNFNTSGFNPYTPNFYPTYTYPQIQPMQTYTSPSNHPVNRSIFGRIVTSENDITPNEDGRACQRGGYGVYDYAS